MSSAIIRVNGSAVGAGTLMASTATITNTGADDVTVDSVAQTSPAPGVASNDLATAAQGQTIPAGESIEIPFSIRALPTAALEHFDVLFDIFLSDGTKCTTNTAKALAIPQTSFLTSPTADGLVPVPGSLNFNSNTNSALLGAV